MVTNYVGVTKLLFVSPRVEGRWKVAEGSSFCQAVLTMFLATECS